jgi:hypothetical protein
MKLSDLRKMRDRAPFRAFELHLANGETLPIQHPEHMALPPEEAGTDLFVVWVGPQWNLIEAGQVARVSVRRPRGKPSGSDQGTEAQS